MAKFYIEYSCGHDGEVQIYGPTKDRQWKADRKAEGLCPECYKKHLAEKRQQENEAAAQKAKEEGFPELIGTEKQVAWANTLRQQFLDDKPKRLRDAQIQVVNYIIQNKNKAEWWINRRLMTPLTIMGKVIEEDKLEI